MPRAKSLRPAMQVEYILVTDKDSKVLKLSTDRYEVVKLANLLRRAGGEVTVFKSTRM